MHGFQTERQAEKGMSLEAQSAKFRAMATVQGAELRTSWRTAAFPPSPPKAKTAAKPAKTDFTTTDQATDPQPKQASKNASSKKGAPKGKTPAKADPTPGSYRFHGTP
jgi:hypothetical protein